MIVGLQSLTLKCIAKVFSLKSSFGKTPYNFVGNVGLYSVGKGMRKTHFKKLQAVGFVGHSQLNLSREVTREIQSGMRLFRFQHVLLTWPFSGCHSRANHEIFFFFTDFHQILTHNSYIKDRKSTRLNSSHVD